MSSASRTPCSRRTRSTSHTATSWVCLWPARTCRCPLPMAPRPIRPTLMRSFGVTAPLPPRTDAGMIQGTASSEAAALRPRKARRVRPGTRELGTWMGVGQGVDVGPLTPSLSPSEGKRVPFKAGEGESANSLRFHGSGFLRLVSECGCIWCLPAAREREADLVKEGNALGDLRHGLQPVVGILNAEHGRSDAELVQFLENGLRVADAGAPRHVVPVCAARMQIMHMHSDQALS